MLQIGSFARVCPDQMTPQYHKTQADHRPTTPSAAVSEPTTTAETFSPSSHRNRPMATAAIKAPIPQIAKTTKAKSHTLPEMQRAHRQL